MPYNQEHNYLSILGTITSEGDVEQWSCGLRFGEGDILMGDEASLGIDVTDLILDDIEADLTTWWGIVGQRMPSAVKLTGFKFNAIGTDGRYLRQDVTYQRDMTPLPGSGSAMLPSQVALAVTFRTAASRGLASTGRIFLPPLAATSCDNGGRVQDATLLSITNATASLLTNLGNWPGVEATAGAPDPGKVCVMSKVGAGATRRVNSVDIGDRFDTIRSRGGKFRENRSTGVVVTS